MQRQNLWKLVIAMLEPRCVYVLGAGTSAGLVPFTSQTLEWIRKPYVDLGMFPPSSATFTPLFQRLVRDPLVASWRQGRGRNDDLLVETIPLSALELLAQKAWSPLIRRTAPPQYYLLQRAARPAVIFTFNLDGLAASYLRRQHRVLEPHGRVDRRLTEHRDFDQLLEASLYVHLFSRAPKLLAGPEPAQITNTSPYVEVRRYLNTASAVIIIGYSFGMFRGRMDDSESFEHLLDSQANQRCPIFVVNPNPEPVATAIEERLRSRRVVPVAIKWDDFSSEVTSVIGPGGELAACLTNDAFQGVCEACEGLL